MSTYRCSILVVDDESYILATLSNLLAGDYDVLTATSAAEAKKIVTEQNIDLILTDQRMPGKTGVHLLEWVRKNSPHTVRLLMTGFAELEEAIDAINRGQVFRYIFKPWKADDLLQSIGHAAHTFRLHRDNELLVKQLQELNQELEERVRARTKELEETNHELEQKNKMLEKLALTDALTNLPNRRAMDRLAERELRRRDRHPSPIAIGLIDVDHFKNINSQFLLPGGDKVLVDLSKCLSNSLRTIDFLGRIGGEEFLVIAPDTDVDGAKALGERIRSTVEKNPFDFKGNKIPVTVSVGFAVAESKVSTEFEQIKHLASAVLSECKMTGRNKCIVKSLGERPFERAG